MNRPFRALIGLAAGAVLLTSAATAAAQDHRPPPPGAAGEHWREHMKEHREAHIRALHDLLQIRPDQEAAFQAFVASMKPPEGADRHKMDGEHGEMAHMTTPQKLDRMQARMAERQAAFERRAAAVKTFYAALSPEQQRAFDAMAAMRHFDGGHGMGGHERMGDDAHGLAGPGDM